MKFFSSRKGFLKSIKQLDEALVGEVMTRDVFTVSPQESLVDAANLMIGQHISSLVVVEKGKEEPLGIITEKDFVNEAPEKISDLRDTVVGDLMTKELITVQPQLSLFEASEIMNKHRFRKIVVTQDDELAGIVTQTDLVLKMNEFYRNNMFHTSDSLTVRAVKEDGLHVNVKDTIRDAHNMMIKEEAGSVFVVEKGKLKGIFTEFDFLSQVAVNPEKMYSMKMGDVMSFPVIAVDQQIDIFDANHLMIEKDFRRLPVYEGDELVGKLTQTTTRKSGFDILRTTLHRAEHGELDPVNFEKVDERPLVRKIDGKVQKYLYATSS